MGRELDVYLRESLAGRLNQDDMGRMSFVYDRDFLEDGNQPISYSMPLREEPFQDSIATPFFSGLLPDEDARKRLGRALGVSAENSFGLLEIVGGECAGALSLLPPNSPSPDLSSTQVDFLTEKRLSELLALLQQKPLLGGEEGIRMSLAGAQDKLAVCVVGGQIAIPKSGRPTTHILKPVMSGLQGTVDNEMFCMMLAKRVGLPVPTVSTSSAGSTQFLLVERFDRFPMQDGKILKLHQEDFCQALSIPPSKKYETKAGRVFLMQCSSFVMHRATQLPIKSTFEK